MYFLNSAAAFFAALGCWTLGWALSTLQPFDKLRLASVKVKFEPVL